MGPRQTPRSTPVGTVALCIAAAVSASVLTAAGLSAASGIGGAFGEPLPDGSIPLPLMGGFLLMVGMGLVGIESARRVRRARHLLQRYVPDAVARRILRGRDPTLGEREVSILFADLQGYTAHVATRTPAEIHALVGRYTLAVSRIIRRHGGSVVEFGGDGLMALFGAPDELLDKEQASLNAAVAIVERVEALGAFDKDPSAPTLQVGVGIATGNAFVGIIPAEGRLVWSAVGNTTNLASRLQALTRDVAAPIVVDETTHSRAIDSALPFSLHAEMKIRGRADAVNVYTLPRHEVQPAVLDLSPCGDLELPLTETA